MFKMVSWMLQVLEFEVASVANFLVARRSSLLPPLSHSKQTYWCKLLYNKDLSSARRIFPEFADFVGRNPGFVALASIASSASGLVFFDSLVLNIFPAMSFLEHGLVAVAEMLSEEVGQRLDSKLWRFLCNNAVTFWISTLLKLRAAALAIAPKYVPRKGRLDLWKSKFLGSDLLFPQEQVIDVNKCCKETAQSLFLDLAVVLEIWLLIRSALPVTLAL